MAIQDARQIDENSRLECDVCVVGGGAAGVTLALQLSRSSMSVILLESGDWKADAQTQELYHGETADESLHSRPQFYRQRRFGGSTTIWSGRCVPYDPIDFEKRDYMPESGWPIGYDEIEPYYRRATRICEAGQYAFRVAEALPGAPAQMIPGFTSQLVETDSLERFSRPTHFARRYRRLMEWSSRLRVILNSNCVHLAVRESRTIDHLTVSTLEGRKFTVAARRFVLATGGLEVTRLLLASRDVFPEGIGNGSDQLGRYYMCHIAGTLGQLELNVARPREFHGYEIAPDGVYCRRRFQLAADEQRRLGVGNLIARMHHPTISDPDHRTGPLSALYLARHLLPREFSKRAHGADRSFSMLARHVRNVVGDPLYTARFLSHWFWRHTLPARKFPSVIVNPRSQRYTLDFHAEQVPNFDSRVQLSNQRDRLGMPRLHIDWRYTPLDVHTVGRSFGVLAQEFERTGVGRLTFQDHEIEAAIMREGAYGGHHIGTTRMSDSASRGVVDHNCRVHGLKNLYIASSSVFPTSSQANPTLTIVALALRLANHLDKFAAPDVVSAAPPEPATAEAL
jgi:choline dehydrogenase-like flavoprotein